jgi:signal transduction histidine kinase
VTAALAAGWVAAVACAVAAIAMRLRLERVADAEHELRGALTAFGLGVDRFARTAAGRRLAVALESELARARAALADLSGARLDASPAAPLDRLLRSAALAWAPAARNGGIEVRWEAGPAAVVDSAGRVAQALGNLVSNAVEHGDGQVRVRALHSPGAVRVEVSNGRQPRSAEPFPHHGGEKAPIIGSGGRGRGLRIAGRAARAAGGRLTVSAARDDVTAVLELPVEP